MENGLRLFQNSFLEGRKKMGRRVTPSKCLTMGDCVFLSSSSLKSSNEPIEILFYIGEEARFLGKRVIIESVSIDENNNVIYRVAYDSGCRTSVDQKLLESEIVFQSRMNLKRRKTMISTKLGLSEPRKLEATPLVEKESLVSTREIVFPSPVSLEPVKQQEEQVDIQIDEILNYLQLQGTSTDFQQVFDVFKVYKFLVQNSKYDKALLKDYLSTLPKEAKADESKLSETRKVALVLQHLLSKVGVKTKIVVSQNKETGLLHDGVLVDLSKNWYFFDVEHEREFGSNLLLGSFSMAALGLEDYTKHYEVIGVLSEMGSSQLYSLPIRVSKSSISAMIKKGIDRQLSDLTYSKSENDIRGVNEKTRRI